MAKKSQTVDTPAEAVEEETEALHDRTTPAPAIGRPAAAIGRIVHYCVDMDDTEPVLVPAIITRLDGDRVDLRIFSAPAHGALAWGARVQTDSGGYYAEGRAEGTDVGTWRWPYVYDPVEDSGGSSFLCTCDEPEPNEHREWCGAGNEPGKSFYEGDKPIPE